MATGTSPVVVASAFHADDPEQTTEYRKLSVLAIISLVFGILSPLAFAGPLLLSIPLFGIAISILALRQIAGSEGGFIGRWAAVAGLFLCVVSALAPFSRDLVFRSIRTREAESVGRNWVELVTAGKTEEAFHLTSDGARPQPAPQHGEPPPKETLYQTFLSQPVVKSLIDAGAGAQIRYVDTVAFDSATYRNVMVRQKFAVSPSPSATANSANKPVEVILLLQRVQLPGENASRWLVSRIDDAAAAAASAPAP